MRTPKETLDRIGNFFISNLKDKEVEIVGMFGKGVIVVTGVEYTRDWYIGGGGYEVSLNVKYIQKEANQGHRWQTPQLVGRRRNDKIRTTIDWGTNDITLMAKVMGIKRLNVNKITVKK